MSEQDIIIRIKSKVHKKTGHIAAFSDDLQGLLVIGATEQEIELKLPGAIKQILEAMGTPVTNVELLPVDDADTEWDGAPQFRAEANRRAA